MFDTTRLQTSCHTVICGSFYRLSNTYRGDRVALREDKEALWNVSVKVTCRPFVVFPFAGAE